MVVKTDHVNVLTRRELLQCSAATVCAAAAPGRFTLIEPGRTAVLVSGADDIATARYFSRVLEDLTGARLEPTTNEPPRDGPPLIRIGNAATDPAVKALLGSERTRRLGQQGVAIRTVSDGTR